MINEDCQHPRHKSQGSKCICMKMFNEINVEFLSNQQLTYFTQENSCHEVWLFEWLRAAWVMRKSRKRKFKDDTRTYKVDNQSRWYGEKFLLMNEIFILPGGINKCTSHFVCLNSLLSFYNISWYCKDSKRVKTYLLDVNCTDENNDDIANTIKHSLVQTFGIDNIPTIFGQCTDSGGGGTGKKLYAEIEKLGLTPLTCYLITSYTLHNLKTALRNGLQLVLGEGGLDSELKGKHNAMQLLDGAYNLQNWHEHDELKDIYLYTQKCEGLDEKFIKLEEPILTRWWLVGACATSVLKCKSTWEKICNGIRQATDTKSAAYKVVSATYTLIQEPFIMSDVHLLVAIHKWFFFPHFKWCQLGDNAVGGTPSFSARNMLVRYFSMMDQVRSAENGKWESLADFEGFKASANGLPDEEQRIQRLKVTHFLRILCASLKKHFGMWIYSNFLFLSLFSEQKTATCIAKFLSGGVRDHEETYDSEAHGSQINLQKLRLFLEQQCKPDTIDPIKNSLFWRANSIPIALRSEYSI